MSAPGSVRFRIPRDVWVGLGAIALSAWYWREADSIPISPLDGAVNAAVIPKALAWAMVGFSVILILRALAVEAMYVRAARQAARPAPRPEDEGRDFTPAQHLKAAGVLAIGIGYLLILPWLGYVPSMALLVGATSIYIGARAGAYSAGVAVAVAVAYDLLFVRLLDIPLPAGFWPSLF